MYAQKLETLPPPPGVFGSLKAGFDVVSSNILLILMPLALDLFLWLGPRLSVSKVLGPLYTLLFEQAKRGLAAPEDVKRLAAFQDVFSEGFKRFNLLSLITRLQTFPVGISSLVAKTMPVDSPMGSDTVIQIPSLLAVLGAMFLLIVAGWIMGGLYFHWVSNIVLAGSEARISPMYAVLQTLILSVIWFLALAILSVPVMLLMTVLTFISPALASGALFVMLLLSFWLIVPLFFTPHGIFVRGQNAIHSILTSFKMARFTLPTSSMFIFSSFILSTGLNYLWSIPKSNSWMTLVGIGGHAFITTALLAASFVYYRDMNIWLQKVFEELQQKKNVPGRII
ncbi:MAG TPA: hypothetical protein VK909_14385 [Anaerolineales bacterium]|nr:hypothetical protein [Anaerolineales bacterium]